jgi:hypothetical protein
MYILMSINNNIKNVTNSFYIKCTIFIYKTFIYFTIMSIFFYHLKFKFRQNYIFKL